MGAAMRWISIGCMVVLFLVLTGVVFVRFVPIAKLSWSDEVVEWTFAWMVFIAAAALWREREHFCVDALSCKLENKPSGMILRLIIEVLSGTFFVILAYFGYMLASHANDRSPILEWPRPLWYACIPIAGIIMAGYSIRSIIGLVVEWVAPDKICGPEMLAQGGKDSLTKNKNHELTESGF